MRVGECVCACVCVGIVWVWVWVQLRVCLFKCKFVCIQVWFYIGEHLYMCGVFVCTRLCLYMSVYGVRFHMHIYMYVSVLTCTSSYKYITNTYSHVESNPRNKRTNQAANSFWLSTHFRIPYWHMQPSARHGETRGYRKRSETQSAPEDGRKWTESQTGKKSRSL